MKKNMLFLFGGGILLLLITIGACNKQRTNSVDEQVYTPHLIPDSIARKIASRVSANHFSNTGTSAQRNAYSGDFRISEREIDTCIIVKDEYDVPALYVYNYSDGGFIVFSAETMHEPICAFVDHGKVSLYDSVPGTLVEWFGKTVENIQFLRRGSYDNTARAKSAWWQLLQETDLTRYADAYRIKPPDDTPTDCESGWNTTTVGPLLRMTWGQECSYNDQLDVNCTNTCNRKAFTGCVATAMAQVIAHWQPVNSYNYNYATMPAGSGNSEVQRLMKDAGKDVNMSYGCNASLADAPKIPGALTNKYGFTSATRSNYGSYSYNTVVNNLNNGWPVILDGYASRRKSWLFWWSYSNGHV